jgi:choline dehydrogenase
MDAFDYIVVGAGSAGCVLAYRLSEDPRHRVLLVEAGPEDKSPLIAMPKGFGKLLGDPNHAAYYPVKPHPGNGGRSDEVWARGKMLGGSSSINGMVYMRGHPADYDSWVSEAGATGWGWSTLGECFRQIEDHALGADDLRGSGGPLKVSLNTGAGELADAVIAACGRLNLPCKPDINRLDHEGVAKLSVTIRNGVRQSASRAFLSAARKRPNLTVVTHARATRVQFEGRRAVAIELRQGHELHSLRASREIILSAGALESPRLLQLSGVGDASHLRSLGIAVVAHSPNVGGNLREHLLYMAQWRLKDWKHSQNRDYAGWRLGRHVLRYLLFKSGPLAQAPYQVGGFFKTRPELDRPDAQLLMAPYTLDFNNAGKSMEKVPGLQLFSYGLRPRSQGHVRITSADPERPAEIDPNYLADPQDQAVAIAALKTMRQIVRQAPLAALIAQETRPGPAVTRDEDLLNLYRQGGQSGYHACGTCRMGGDADSVLDPQLRVRGVERLRVMDLSVAPTMISGNTNGPVMAMAWHAADLILATRNA